MATLSVPALQFYTHTLPSPPPLFIVFNKWSLCVRVRGRRGGVRKSKQPDAIPAPFSLSLSLSSLSLSPLLENVSRFLSFSLHKSRRCCFCFCVVSSLSCVVVSLSATAVDIASAPLPSASAYGPRRVQRRRRRRLQREAWMLAKLQFLRLSPLARDVWLGKGDSKNV